MTRPHPGAQPEPPHWNKRHSGHLGNSKGFTSSVSGNGVKDQILAGTRSKDQCIFLIISHLPKVKGQQDIAHLGICTTLVCKRERLHSVQFNSVAQSCTTLCDPMNLSTPSLPVHHQFLEFTQTHVHRVSDAIQPSHPLSYPSPPAPNPSQHQSLFQ